MKFERKNALAIDPHYASADWNYTAAPMNEPVVVDGVALIEIRGPLSHHCDWFFESYDEIVQKVQAAHDCAEARSVLINGDTPGGEVSGCFSTARIMRQIADKSGKPMLWYVDGQTCSAGLALAMACDRVVLPPEGRFGSIGVIAELQSVAEQAAKQGVDVRLITSGARKADGHPLQPISDETVATIQESVDYEAALFMQWVSERTTIPVDTIQSWQAAVFHGQQAIDVGLADALTDDLGAHAMAAAPAEQGKKSMPGLANKAASASSAKKASLEEARKMLGELSSEDSDEGRAARKMLDASDAEGEEDEAPADKAPHKEPDGDEGEDEADDDASDDSDEDDAEDSADDDSAEDESDAKKAEDESRKAKAEDEAARKADADARTHLKSGAKDAAKLARRALASADRHRAAARQHRTLASVFASNARTQAVVANLGKTPRAKGPKAADALAGGRAKGTPPASAAVDPLASVPKNWRVLAGLDNSAEVVDLDSETPGLGALSPSAAKAAYDKIQATFKGAR